MNDERLRQLYGRGMAGRDARSELLGACEVAPERLLALVRRELPEEEQLELLDEVMSSGACREAFELLRVVEAVGRQGEQPPLVGPTARGPSAATPAVRSAANREVTTDRGAGDSSQSHPWWHRNGVSLALAASVLLAVGLFARDRGGDGPEVTRGAGDGVTLVAPAIRPGATDDVTHFVWRAIPGATDYEFQLLDASGEPLHQATTIDTVMTWPTGVTLLPGTEYRWLVRARVSGGQRSSPARQLWIPAP